MSDGEDAAPGHAAASNPPTEYITLNPNSEPLRLESLCTSCMKNVRGREPAHRCARLTARPRHARRARRRC